MVIQLLALFLSAFLGGVSLIILPAIKPSIFRWILVFAGSYLFAITILHLLPDLMAMHAINKHVALYILLGFFLQLLLGFFSKGAEHGHTHAMTEHNHQLTPITILTSLSIHAFLDGVIINSALAESLHHHHHHHTVNTLLIGIVFHKLSESFALVSILNKLIANYSRVMIYLLLFSLASPLGLLVSKYGSQQLLLSQNMLVALSAIAAGNFLHIATTIFYENSHNHRINLSTLTAIVTGIGMVIVLEYFL